MSSLFAALGVSVEGLQAQSASIGNISDNLSNSQTTAYKSIGTSFQDLVTSSSATNNTPGGVTATPNYQNSVQGTIASTSTTTNMAISGQGYFNVGTAVQTSTGATQFTGSEYFTRQGDFSLDKDGYLVNSSGYYLQGFSINSTSGKASNTLSQVQISSTLDAPVPTSTISYAANLPLGATAGSFTSSASTIQVYDAGGGTHQVSLTWVKTGSNQWSVSVDVAGGAASGASDYTATVPVTFSSAAGTVGTLSSIAAATSTGASGGYTVDSSATSAGVSFSLNFGQTGSQTVDLNLGSYGSASGVTQFAGSSSSSTDVTTSSFTQNGLGQGQFSSVGINSSGIVSINYTNGSVRQIYQVPIATFNSPDNLQRLSGGAYQATLASGAAQVHNPGESGAGTVTSSALEASDVDISSEFTQMIQAQQIYSGNAKVVTVVNQMLSTIIQAVQ